MALLLTTLYLILQFFNTNCIKEATFRKTENLTLSSWSAVITGDLTLSTHYHCAAACLKNQETCNAWKYDDNNLLCSLGQVTNCIFLSHTLCFSKIEYLEDTDGTPTVEIHVESNTIHNVDMKCRGSKS